MLPSGSRETTHASSRSATAGSRATRPSAALAASGVAKVTVSRWSMALSSRVDDRCSPGSAARSCPVTPRQDSLRCNTANANEPSPPRMARCHAPCVEGDRDRRREVEAGHARSHGDGEAAVGAGEQRRAEPGPLGAEGEHDAGRERRPVEARPSGWTAIRQGVAGGSRAAPPLVGRNAARPSRAGLPGARDRAGRW